MNRAAEIIMNFLIQREVIDAASTGNAIAVVIAIDYAFLLVASITGLAVIIERAVRLRGTRIMDASLIDAVPERVQTGDLPGAVRLAEGSKTVVGKALAVELNEYEVGHVPIEEAIETADGLVDEKLNANLDILSTVAKVAPLLGLLGTVLGMMYAFGQLDVGSRKETLAHGITAALDTTVRGLIIAIICLTFEGIFVRRIQKIAQQTASFFTEVVRAARRGSAGKGD